MAKAIDMTGWIMSEHGVPNSRLIVIYRVENSKNGKAKWRCVCSCNEHNEIVAHGVNLRNGNTLSCGCLLRETASQTHKKYNEYDISGEYGVGWTSNTNKEFYFDLEDYDKIKDYCWYENSVKGMSTLVAHVKNKLMTMHTLLGFKNYDHIDRNELNNRKSNLRIATASQNSMNQNLSKRNTSGVIGVCWKNLTQIWEAWITCNHSTIYLGSFHNKRDAIKARLLAEAKYFGEFSPQQHLFEEYGVEAVHSNE